MSDNELELLKQKRDLLVREVIIQSASIARIKTTTIEDFIGFFSKKKAKQYFLKHFWQEIDKICWIVGFDEDKKAEVIVVANEYLEVAGVEQK